MTETRNVKYGKQYRIYKPIKAGGGAASKLESRTNWDEKGVSEVTAFWVAAAQVGLDDFGNGKFGWETDSVTLKLGVVDIAAILTFFDGRSISKSKDSSGQWRESPATKIQLFHDPNKGRSDEEAGPGKDSTVLSLSKNADRAGYKLEMSASRGGKLLKVGHQITEEEVTVLKVWLNKVLLENFT